MPVKDGLLIVTMINYGRDRDNAFSFRSRQKSERFLPTWKGECVSTWPPEMPLLTPLALAIGEARAFHASDS